MEFLDEDARPRFVFQSGAASAATTEPQPYHNHNHARPILFATVAFSSILFTFALFFIQSEPFKSLLLWLSLSLLVGPFAPNSLTGGNVRVGRGHIVEFPDPEPAADEDSRKRASQRRSKPRRSEDVVFVSPAATIAKGGESGKNRGEGNGNRVAEETEWTEEDVEVLKKQIVKHPVGKPGRWEAIAEAFGGRHKVEGVIKKVKELGEKRVDDSDSYAQFLKKRKALDKRVVENEDGEGGLVTAEKEESGWSSGEDIALLNALKAFPKDAPMRWEKIAAAVPGKSKAACMKRVTELKKEFRSSKAAADG